MKGLKNIGIIALFGFVACTQFIDNEEGKSTYAGNDGCVYCHTNAVRLQALAVAEEGSAAGGG